MKDRVSTEVLSNGALRYAEYDENGVFQQYRYLILDDDPTEVGTPLNAALFNYFNAAVGTTAGTSANYTLAGDGGFSLADGATVRFKLHTDTASGATLDVNSTGALPMLLAPGINIPAGIAAGTWLTATYSATNNAFMINFAPFSGDTVTSGGITFDVHIVGNFFVAFGTATSCVADGKSQFSVDLTNFSPKYNVLFGSAGGWCGSEGAYRSGAFSGVITSPYKIYFTLVAEIMGSNTLSNANVILVGTVS